MYSSRANRWKSSSNALSENNAKTINALSPLAHGLQKRKHIRSKTKSQGSLQQNISGMTVGDIEVDEKNFLIQYQSNEGKIDLGFPHMIKDHLKKYKSFYTMLKDEYNDTTEETMLKLSLQFSLSVYDKNSIIFRFNDQATHYHLLLIGEVDVLFPYYEKAHLSPEEMIVYLLRLKQYNETELLSRVIDMNSDQFNFGDNKFDIWVTQAYNTLLKLKRFLRNDSKTDNTILIKTSDRSNETSNSKAKKRYDNEVEKDREVRLFEYAKDIKFVNKIEYELMEAIKIAHPKLIGHEHKEQIKTVGISAMDYIMRIYPPVLPQYHSSIKEVTVIKYYHDRSFTIGDHYGDIAVDAHDNSMCYPLPRLYTLITKEESHIGRFTKKAYNDHIKGAIERSRKEKIELLKEYRIFRRSQNNFLIKNYASFFYERDISCNDYIIQERMKQKDNQKVFFIKNGEFEVVCVKSICEIDQMLTDLGFGEIIQDKIRTNTTPETDNYFLTINIRTKFRLNYFRYNDIVGLPDCYLHGIYLYSVQCRSKIGQVLEISMNLLEYIMSIDAAIHESADQLIISKRRVFSELLFKQRDTKLDFSHVFKKNLQYPSKPRLNINIFKRASNVPYVPKMAPNFVMKDNDIDITLVNSSSKYTLDEIRRRNKITFIQKYKEKMSKLKIKKRDNFKIENKLLKSASVKGIEFKYDVGRNTRQNLQSNNSCSVDPLAFDNIDRMYNTQFYFKKVFNPNSKRQHLNIKVENEPEYMKKKSRSCSNINNRERNKTRDRYGECNKEGRTSVIKDRDRTLHLTTIKLRSIYEGKSSHKREFHKSHE